MKVIISGGGTGGHVFPAIAIGQELRRRYPSAEVLFVGAIGKMEMEKVPQAGFEIKGLDVIGFNRTNMMKNLSLPFKLIKSLRQAWSILKEFKPQVVVGVGGFASGPTLFVASRMGIPTLIQEQNSYAGVTNKFLSKKAKTICVAYNGMDKFFSAEKIKLTGNPVRQDLMEISSKHSEAAAYFKLDPQKKTILVMGGSLGAKTLNQCMEYNLDFIKSDTSIQWIWQYGKQGIKTYATNSYADITNVYASPFIERTDLAYALADVILCRAGALTISEILLVQKPVVLVPSPMVAEDHQTHNAMALVNQGAALLVKDDQAVKLAITTVLNLLGDSKHMEEMKAAQVDLAKPQATSDIVHEIVHLIPTVK